MDFDLRLLQHARALAEEGSFARAAISLHLTQPALSRSIQELERRIGFSLFERNKGRVEPTDLGRVFLTHARDLLARAQALEWEVATLRGSGTGSLVIGSSTFPTAMFMALAVGTFLRKHRGVGVRIVSDSSVSLVAALRRRELDFAVAAKPVTEESAGLATHSLSPRQGHFFVRLRHPLLSKDNLSLEDIAVWPIICTARLAPGVMQNLLAARKRRDAKGPLPDFACESHEMMCRIAAASDHVLLSSLSACMTAIAAQELTMLPFSDPRINVVFSILRLEARTLPQIADELVREVIAADRTTLQAELELAARLLKPRSEVLPPKTGATTIGKRVANRHPVAE